MSKIVFSMQNITTSPFSTSLISHSMLNSQSCRSTETRRRLWKYPDLFYRVAQKSGTFHFHLLYRVLHIIHAES